MTAQEVVDKWGNARLAFRNLRKGTITFAGLFPDLTEIALMWEEDEMWSLTLSAGESDTLDNWYDGESWYDSVMRVEVKVNHEVVYRYTRR